MKPTLTEPWKGWRWKAAVIVLGVVIIAVITASAFAMLSLCCAPPPFFAQTSTAIGLTNDAIQSTLGTGEAQTQQAPLTRIADLEVTFTAEAVSTGTPPTAAPCYFNWATQDLPELSAEVQAAIEDAGLEDMTVIASAYGENCYANDTNEVQYFAAMQTDFRVTAQVDDLEDTEALGNLTADILAVLNEFPPDETPGLLPGQITLTFMKGSEQIVLPVSMKVVAQMVEQGMRGAQLWVALNDIR